MNILITGAAGYIGSHMFKHAQLRGHRVWGLDNLSTGFRDALPADRLIEFDLVAGTGLDKLLVEHGIQAVIHFAGRIQVGESVREPLLYWEQNVSGTHRLLAACKEAGVRRFVFSSSAAIYGQPDVDIIEESQPAAPINPYGWTKLVGERMLSDADTGFGLRSVSLRYFNAAGADPEGQLGERHEPETHLIPLVLQAANGRREAITINGRDFPTPDGTCVRDYVHVWDLCEAHLLALDYLDNGGATTALNLGTGSGFSILQVVQACQSCTGRDFPVRFGERRAGDPARLVAATRRAHELLGWVPTRSDLATIIQDAWRWERTRHP